MWSEDPTWNEREAEEEQPERRPPQLGGLVRWFFGFDGWQADPEEGEFVLA